MRLNYEILIWNQPAKRAHSIVYLNIYIIILKLWHSLIDSEQNKNKRFKFIFYFYDSKKQMAKFVI